MSGGHAVFQGLLLPAGFQSSTLSNSTAVGVNSTLRGNKPTVLHVSVETNSVRYRTDGTDPTKNTGVLLAAGSDYWFSGYNNTSLMKFQRSTGTAKLSIMAYKPLGNVSG